MPIDSHSVSPTRIAATGGTVDDADELAYIANFTLCSLIRQLSSLSGLTSNFGREMTVKINRLRNRQQRIRHRLSLIDQIMDNDDQYRSAETHRQMSAILPELVDRINEEENQAEDDDESPLADAYHRIALPAPALYMLNKFRDDNRDSSSFYSDPSVFHLQRRVSSKMPSAHNSHQSRHPSSSYSHQQQRRPTTTTTSASYRHHQQQQQQQQSQNGDAKSSLSSYMPIPEKRSPPPCPPERPISVSTSDDIYQSVAAYPNNHNNRSITPSADAYYLEGQNYPGDDDFPPPPPSFLECEDFPMMVQESFNPPIPPPLPTPNLDVTLRPTNQAIPPPPPLSASQKYATCTSVNSDLMAEIRRGFTLRKVKSKQIYSRQSSIPKNESSTTSSSTSEPTNVRQLMAQALKHRRKLVDGNSLDQSNSSFGSGDGNAVTDL